MPELSPITGVAHQTTGWERNLYSRFPEVGISLFVALQLLMFGVSAIAMLGVQLTAQPFFAGGVINGLGHHVGYRSFELPTAATNIVPWGVLIGGEELHNNHHAFRSSPPPRRAGLGDRPGVVLHPRVSCARTRASATLRRRRTSCATVPA